MRITLQNGYPSARPAPKTNVLASAPVKFSGDAYSPLMQDTMKHLTEKLTRVGWDVKNMFFHRNSPNTRVRDAVFTVFDLETTGLDPKADAITEIAALKYQNGRVIDRFTTLVNPEQPISDFVQDMTGITPAMVAQAPKAKAALQDLARFVGKNPILVGHYVNFDIDMIREKLGKYGLQHCQDRFMQENAFCTKTLGQLVLPGLESYSGVPLGKRLGVVNDQPHRAEAYVRMTGSILYRLWTLVRRDVDTLGELGTYQGGVIRDYDAKPPKLTGK